MGTIIIGFMSEVRELGQRHIAALWDAARSLGSDETAHAQLGGLLDAVAEAEAQLAGVKLHLLHEARLTGAESVLAEVRESVRTTAAQAVSVLRLAVDLGERFEVIAAALHDGRVSLPQAEAIASGLRRLPKHLSRAELVRCQESLLEHVGMLGPAELRELAARLWEIIDPEQAEAEDAKRLAAEERAARRGRFLRLSPDHHGSIRISGQLPVAEAAQLSAQLEALLPSASSYTDSGEVATREMRRADALVLLCQAAAASETLPVRGGDRPTVHVTLSLETLMTGLGEAGVFGTQGLETISAGQARRLACHASLIPVVLDGQSRPLDVGREKRLFTPAMIAALTQRDKGCAFPHCQVAAVLCHAHHIVPWWAWGPTCVDNGVMLCPYHHRLVEPDPLLSAESQWQVRLDPVTGLPWFTPPRDIDPARRPRQHTRYILRSIKLGPVGKAPPCPPEATDELEARRAQALDDLNKLASHNWTQHT